VREAICAWLASQLVATRGIAEREERVGALGNGPKPVVQENGPAEKKFAYRRGESEPVLRANLRAAYWLPAAGLPALRMEEAATKMRAAL